MLTCELTQHPLHEESSKCPYKAREQDKGVSSGVPGDSLLYCATAPGTNRMDVSCRRQAARVSAGTSAIVLKAAAADETATTCGCHEHR